MRYTRPNVTEAADLAEGIYAASGSVSAEAEGCKYQNATVTINERDFNANKYRATIKADHVGKVNDRKGATITFTSTVVLNGFNVRTSGYSCSQSSGTEFTITYVGSHHSELNCEVEFMADTEPNVSATATP